MKLKNLKIIITSFVVAAFLVLSGCKDKKDSDTTTTTGDTVSTEMGDTAGTTATTTDPTKTTGKRTGRVSTTVATVDKSVKMEADVQGFYNYTETAPVYPGGQSELENYLNSNFQYPEDAMENNVQGTVTVKFTIDENGKVGNVQTTGETLGHGLEEEARRVVSNMPTWTPGMVNGKKVKAWYTIPLTFRIES